MNTRQSEPEGYEHGWFDGFANMQPATEDPAYFVGWMNGQTERTA
jgi:hypothetical protein